MPRTKRITDTPEAARKGIKAAKGQPIFYSEKKQRVNLTLTPTASEGLEKFAQALNLSVSEFVERIGRGTIPFTLWDAAGSAEHRALHQALLNNNPLSVVVFPSRVERSRFEALIQKMAAVLAVEPSHYEPLGQYNFASNPILTTEAENAGQQTQTAQVAPEHNLLTTQQAWEVARSRGYTKSKDAFRAWSRRSPEKCRELHGLIVITDPQQGKMIGYQDDQANETLEK